MRTRNPLVPAVAAVSLVALCPLAAPIAASGAGLPAMPRPAAAPPSGEVPDIVWPPEGTTPPQLSDEQVAARGAELEDRMAAVFPEVVPHAFDIAVDELLPLGPENESVMGHVAFHDRLGKTVVTTQYGAPGFMKRSPRQYCESNQSWTIVTCDGVTLPDGAVLLHSTGHSGDPAYLAATATRFSPDGSTAIFTSYQRNPIPGEPDEWRDEFAVPFEQLDELATDPELTFP